MELHSISGSLTAIQIDGYSVGSFAMEGWHRIILQLDDDGATVFLNGLSLGAYTYPNGIELSGGWGSDLSLQLGTDGRAFLDNIAIYDGKHAPEDLP